MQKVEISIGSQKKLQKLFTLTGKKEQQLEYARQNLCKLESFEPYASFQRLDRLCKGYLVPKDLLGLLRDNGIDSAEEIDAKLLINYFDSTRSGKLLFSDYIQMLLPCDQPYLRAIATQRQTYPITSKDFLPYDVERALVKVVQKELKLAKEQENIKQEMAVRYDFDIEKLFKEVDDWNYKYIDHKNLKRFLNKMGQLSANENHVIAIIRRFDIDADCKLTFQEFASGILPQTDYSKRTIKDRICRPSVNNREFALSPGRVPETLAINKEETVNVHHSPLRVKRGQQKIIIQSEHNSRGDLSARHTSSKKSKRKQSRSKSKSYRTQKNSRRVCPQSAGYMTNVNLRKEFESFRKVLKGQEEVKFSNEEIRKGYESDAYTPKYAQQKDMSPLRVKPQTSGTPGKYQMGTPKLASTNTTINKSILSPKSPLNISSTRQQYLTHKGILKIETTPKHGLAQELSMIRALRSPYATKMEQQEEGESSLVFLTRDAFKEILAIEGGLELAKKELCLRPDFCLPQAFTLFSDNSHARIDANDLLYGLQKLGISCDLQDARLVIDRYDNDNDGRLGFWEFSNALLPLQMGVREEAENRRAGKWELSGETKEIIKKTFRRVVDAEVMIESIRQRISREKTVQLRDAFDSLDWLGRGFLTVNEFKRSFERISERLKSPSLHHEIVVRIEDSLEMEGMIRRFNKDKLNGRISLVEFLDELTPKSNDKKY